MAGLIQTDSPPMQVTTEINGQSMNSQMEAVQFELTVERTMASAVETNLGVDCFSCEKGLLIEQVKEGLISKWNKENPCWVVKAGDCICAINDVIGHGSAMMDEVVTADTLKIGIYRKALGDSNHGCSQMFGTPNCLSVPADTGDDPTALWMRLPTAVSSVPVNGSLPLTTEVLAIFTASFEEDKSMATKPRYVPDVKKQKWKLKNVSLETMKDPMFKVGSSQTLTMSTTATNPVRKDSFPDSMRLGSGIPDEAVEMEVKAPIKSMVSPDPASNMCIAMSTMTTISFKSTGTVTTMSTRSRKHCT